MNDTTSEVSTLRLYLLRIMFLLMAVGNIVTQFPGIFSHPDTYSMWRGVGMSFLGALALMSLLGVRYPVKMIPLMIFELIWKLFYVLAFAVPRYMHHTVDPDTAESFVNCMGGVILVPLVLPWGYVWRHYVRAPGDRWGKRV